MTDPVPRPLSVREVLALSFTRRRRGSGFWFGSAIAALWPFTMFGARVAFAGGEHLPRTGGALLACNHVSEVDPIYDVAFAISHGRMPRFLAKAELWRIPVVRTVMAGGRHIPVHRASIRAADAYKEAIEALRRGEVVVFYPEGTFTADPDGLADEGEERDRADRPGHRGAGDPGRELGHAGPAAAGPPPALRSRARRCRSWPARRSTCRAGSGGPRTRTALDGATGAIMADITALVAELRGEEPPAVPYDPALAAVRPPAPAVRPGARGPGGELTAAGRRSAGGQARAARSPPARAAPGGSSTARVAISCAVSPNDMAWISGWITIDASGPMMCAPSSRPVPRSASTLQKPVSSSIAHPYATSP